MLGQTVQKQLLAIVEVQVAGITYHTQCSAAAATLKPVNFNRCEIADCNRIVVLLLAKCKNNKLFFKHLKLKRKAEKNSIDNDDDDNDGEKEVQIRRRY